MNTRFLFKYLLNLALFDDLCSRLSDECHKWNVFCIVNLFSDLLKKSSPSRIINVSSVAHKRLKEVQFDNLNSEKRYRQGSTYGRTKVLLNLFTNELARRLNGTGK